MTANKRLRSLLYVLIGICLACSALVVWEIRQRARDQATKELLPALRQWDMKRAIALVEAGADPNANPDFIPPGSLWEALQRMWVFGGRLDKRSRTLFYVANEEAGWEVRDPGAPPDADLARLDEVMLQHGADINVRGQGNPGSSALWYAVSLPRPQTAKVLLAHGADVNLPGRFDRTPLMQAIDRNNIPMALLLLEHHADVNQVSKYGETVLGTLADSDENIPLVRELLRHSLDVNYRFQNGPSPLQVAQRSNATEMVKLLREAGAKE